MLKGSSLELNVTQPDGDLLMRLVVRFPKRTSGDPLSNKLAEFSRPVGPIDFIVQCDRTTYGLTAENLEAFLLDIARTQIEVINTENATE